MERYEKPVMTLEEIEDDLDRAIAYLGSADGFAYPYGDVTEEAQEAVRNLGIVCAFFYLISGPVIAIYNLTFGVVIAISYLILGVNSTIRDFLSYLCTFLLYI